MISGNTMWPAEICKNTGWKEYGGQKIFTFSETPPSLYHSLVHTAYIYGDKTAFTNQESISLTYREFLQRVNSFAAWLTSEAELKPDDRIGLLLYTGIEFCIALYAISKIGAVAIPFSYKYKKQELLPLTRQAGLKAMVCEDKMSSLFTDSPFTTVSSLPQKSGCGLDHLSSSQPCSAAGRMESDALILFTSGTTAGSKGVVLTNYNIMHAIVAYQRIFAVSQQDSSIIPIPIYHITGVVALLGLSVHCGMSLWLHKRFHPKQVLECILNNNITFFHASPTVFSFLLQEQSHYPSIKSLRIFACGSSNMPPENIRRLKQWIPSAAFHTIYGLTETSSPATIFPVDAASSKYIGASGIPIPGLELKIADGCGKEKPNGEQGEIWLRGTVVTRRYINVDNQQFFKDGWLRTGDIGRVNSEGYLYVADRKKDIINRGGEKISTFEVENALCSFPNILEAAVVGIPDAMYGEVAAAAVCPAPQSIWTEEALQNMLQNRLAKYKVPVKILFTHELPKKRSGKIDKQALQKILEADRGNN